MDEVATTVVSEPVVLKESEPIEARLRAWGSSFGIVVPIEIKRAMKLRDGQHIRIIVLRD